MNTRQRNTNVWESIYNHSSVGMTYPNDVLVRVTHRLLNCEKHNKILEYGFGGGADFLHFCRKGFTVSGVEVSQSAIDNLENKLKSLDISADLKLLTDGKIPFSDASFDAVIAWQVLYYNDWAGFEFAMNEINRVLKPGGIFLGTMGAVGDYTHTHSHSLGDSLYESTVPGQVGAVVMILEEEQLEKCFKGEKIKTGQFTYSFGDFHGRHWIISYEKGEK